MPNVAQRGGMSADAAGDWLGDTFSLVPSVARVAGAVIGKVKVGVEDTLVAAERLIEEGLLRTPLSRKVITVLRAAAVLAIFLLANAASRS